MANIKVNLMSVLLAIGLASLLQTICAQNYHFSNGWYSGKKRSMPITDHSAESSVEKMADGAMRNNLEILRAFKDECNVRPEALALISKIIREEASRIQKSCVLAPNNMGLNDLLEKTVRKVEKFERDPKW